MEDKRYKIEEESTSGWHEHKTNLTKEECKKLHDELINEGISPQRLKITRVQ
jgi:hypothetical protein|tara:strand:+ start:276 stop:431 length:156 start_codon:yes stop_codon:yes gene_type:complete